MAFDPFSPVRILIDSSRGRMNIFPSPVLPVLATLIIASVTVLTKSSLTAISKRTFLRRFTSVTTPR